MTVPPHRPACRGLGLIELLVAVALLGLGAAALVRLYQTLRLTTDLSRQRAEATRLAARDLESLRWRSENPAPGTTLTRWTDITTRGPTPVDTPRPPGAPEAPTRYQHERLVQVDAGDPLKHVVSRVTWQDRQGHAQAVELATALARLDADLGAALLLSRAVPRGGTPGVAPTRALSIPPDARALGDGRHAFKPLADAPLIWLFDSLTAEVIGRCDGDVGVRNDPLDAGSLGTCKTISGVLLAGHVRFATDRDSLGARDAEQPTGTAMSLGLKLTLTTTGHPSPAWECAHDGPVGVPPATTTRTSIRYHCVIQPVPPAAGGLPRWSGRLDLVPAGWQIVSSTGSTGRYRVCRYSADHDGNGRIDNPEHPGSYSVVTGPLGNQNFLVIRAAARCPVDTGPFLANNPVDDSTVAHQP
jgi:prepilin-type N-terminal cleavage/methylation domain-containing protein